MRADEIPLGLGGAHTINSGNHEHCHATLNDSPDECGKALSYKQKPWGDVHIMSQLHIGDKPSIVLTRINFLFGTKCNSLESLLDGDITIEFESHVGHWLPEEGISANEFREQVELVTADICEGLDDPNRNKVDRW